MLQDNLQRVLQKYETIQIDTSVDLGLAKDQNKLLGSTVENFINKASQWLF